MCQWGGGGDIFKPLCRGGGEGAVPWFSGPVGWLAPLSVPLDPWDSCLVLVFGGSEELPAVFLVTGDKILFRATSFAMGLFHPRHFLTVNPSELREVQWQGSAHPAGSWWQQGRYQLLCSRQNAFTKSGKVGLTWVTEEGKLDLSSVQT